MSTEYGPSTPTMSDVLKAAQDTSELIERFRHTELAARILPQRNYKEREKRAESTLYIIRPLSEAESTELAAQLVYSESDNPHARSVRKSRPVTIDRPFVANSYNAAKSIEGNPVIEYYSGPGQLLYCDPETGREFQEQWVLQIPASDLEHIEMKERCAGEPVSHFVGSGLISHSVEPLPAQQL
jgi:hypothetical protein